MTLNEPLSEAELKRRLSIAADEHRQTIYSGSTDQNVDSFLDEIESISERAGIPRAQWVNVALYFMSESTQPAMRGFKENIDSKEKNPEEVWDIFKSILRELHARRARSGPEHPFLEAATGTVVVAGVTYTAGPPLIVTALGAVGFTSSGIAASSWAALAESVFYGANTTGLFSSLTSIGVTGVVASPPVLIFGAGTVGLVAGVGIYLVRTSRRN
ncbi:hypothetical protein GYMLUDRAFT_82202 [Collybiopsis luxurians FD-317 M1]|nr:hypothetical protein GYMLUDRAFT_82202 [Collybiopsis luxurians FD-317 M1]